METVSRTMVSGSLRCGEPKEAGVNITVKGLVRSVARFVSSTGNNSDKRA